MSTENNLTAFGYVLKKEKLASYDAKGIHDLVLKTVSPFPGYYSDVLHRHSENGSQTNLTPTPFEGAITSFYLVAKPIISCLGDTAIRAVQGVKSEKNFSFDAKPGVLELKGENHFCLRIRLDDWHNLPEIIDALKARGIVTLKQKDVQEFDSEIKISKAFKLNETAQGIYKDLILDKRNYIKLPAEISLSELEKLTIDIRNNYNYKIFDIALAAIFTEDGIDDLLRVYDKEATTEQLKLLQERFVKKMAGH